MNKTEYINKLLAMCTTRQQLLFDRMYPNGVEPKRIGWAITQLENTLFRNNYTKETLKDLEKQHKSEIELLKSEITAISQCLKETQRELIEANRQRPAICDKDIERLALLDALERAGVDNWEGYDFALDILNEEVE